MVIISRGNMKAVYKRSVLVISRGITTFVYKRVVLIISRGIMTAVYQHSVLFIYFTEFGAALTTVLPVFFNYCYKYCYSDSLKFEP